MFSSWPGLVHYMCILYESSQHAVGVDHRCTQSLTMINQISFLMQMSWQVAMAHGVFRYLKYDRPVMTATPLLLRHIICWGVPLIVIGMLGALFPLAYQHDVEGHGSHHHILEPFCGISDSTSHRGAKAIFVHAPHILGVVLYAYYYFFVAASVDPDSKHGASMEDASLAVRTYEETRISTSPHHSLLHTSSERRMLDISRAVVTLRFCMAAFVAAYLLETICAIIVGDFPMAKWASNTLYYLRVFSVTPQQFIYACVFSNQKAGSIAGHFLEFHTATIKSSTGKVLANVNTTVNRMMFDKTVDKPSKTVKMGVKGASNRAASVLNVVSDGTNIFIDNDVSSLGVYLSKTVGTFMQAVFFTPVSFFVWVPIHFIQNNYTEALLEILAGIIGYATLVLFPFVYLQGTPNQPDYVVRGHVAMVCAICVWGVYKNRRVPSLLVIDGPTDKVRSNYRATLLFLGLPPPFHCLSLAFHCLSAACPWLSTGFSLHWPSGNWFAYGAVIVEFWQVRHHILPCARSLSSQLRHRLLPCVLPLRMRGC